MRALGTSHLVYVQIFVLPPQAYVNQIKILVNTANLYVNEMFVRLEEFREEYEGSRQRSEESVEWIGLGGSFTWSKYSDLLEVVAFTILM